MMQVSAEITSSILAKHHCPNLERLFDLQSELATLEPERRKLAATQEELSLAHERLATALAERDYDRVSRLATVCERLVRNVASIDKTIRRIEAATRDAMQDAAFLVGCSAEEKAILAYEKEETRAREAWATMDKNDFLMNGVFDRVLPAPLLEPGALVIVVQLPDPEARDCGTKYLRAVVLCESEQRGQWWVAHTDYSTVVFQRVQASTLHAFE